MLIRESKNPVTFFNLLLVVLSIVVLLVFILEFFIEFDEELKKLLSFFDFLICLVFLYDFVKNFIQAKSKWDYMKWGWIDLLASIPSVDYLRVGRIMRLIRLFRLFRVIKSSRELYGLMFYNKAKGVFSSLAIISILLLIICSMLILRFESGNGGSINNAEDAIWWSFVTITTVGYGDFYPVTTGGRIIASLLMVCGVGLFGTLSASMASWFLRDN